MKRFGFLLLTFFMLVCIQPVSGQSSRDAMEESNHEFAEWTASLAGFVRDVRFDEKDMQSFLSLYDDFSDIGVHSENGDEEYVDFNTILDDAEYLSWARARGIDSETWLRKTMRIIAVMMRTEMEENGSEEQLDLESQLAELEEMRSRIGEESYQQMKQALEAGAAALAGMEDSYHNLPVPTGTEKTLIAKYKERLMNLE